MTMNKKNTNIVFMGTPQIAKECLEQLVMDGYNIIAAFTREDKPVGRKQVLTPPPVKVYAQEQGIKVYQPKTLKGEGEQIIKQLSPDMIVVVAYGRLLPKSVIDVPNLGCINLHVSLLPKYRGAAPIQRAIINGDKTTGVTVMFIDEGLDTGDIIDVLPIDIDSDETQEELFCKVGQRGKVFLSKVIGNIIAGTATKTPQNNALATLAPPLTKEMALFSFDETAEVLHNKIRGQNPWPGAHFICQDKKIKVIKAKISNNKGKPCEILSLKPLIIATKDNAIELITVQPEGSKAMEGYQWALGRRFVKGDFIQI